MSVREGVVFLKEIEHFKSFEDSELEQILVRCYEREVEPGKEIVEEGETGREMFLVLEGEVEVYKKVDAGRQYLATLEPGSLFGEMSLLDGSPRSATVVSGAKGARLLCFSEKIIDRLSDEAPELACNFIIALVRYAARKIGGIKERLIFALAMEEKKKKLKF